MKSVITFFFLAATVSTANAQLYFCSRPAQPYLRSAYSADYDDMQRSQDEVAQYLDEMEEYLGCLKREHEDAISEAESVSDEWERTVRQFNNR